jgi:hypothetical protein
MADSIAEALQRMNDAAIVQAMDVRTAYLVMGQSEAADSPGQRWARWENLRRKASPELQSHLAPSSSTPWWVRWEVR